MNPRVRVTIAFMVLGGYAALCTALAFLIGTGFEAFLCSLGGLYAVAAFGLGANYFWARWFARGVAYWGASTAALLMWLGGVGAVLMAVAVTHAIVVYLVSGKDLVERYEGQPAWRSRIDPRLHSLVGDVFVNLGSIVPYALYYGLYPRQVSSADGGVLAALALVALAGAFVGMNRLRTWGLLAVFASAALLGASSIVEGSVLGIAIAVALSFGAFRFVPLIGRYLFPASTDRP